MLPVCQKEERCQGRVWDNLICKEKEDFPESVRSSMMIKNKMGPRTLGVPWGYSSLDKERRRKGSVESHTLATRVEEVRNPRVQLDLDSIGRQLESRAGCQTVSKTRDTVCQKRRP